MTTSCRHHTPHPQSPDRLRTRGRIGSPHTTTPNIATPFQPCIRSSIHPRPRHCHRHNLPRSRTSRHLHTSRYKHPSSPRTPPRCNGSHTPPHSSLSIHHTRPRSRRRTLPDQPATRPHKCLSTTIFCNSARSTTTRPPRGTSSCNRPRPSHSRRHILPVRLATHLHTPSGMCPLWTHHPRSTHTHILRGNVASTRQPPASFHRRTVRRYRVWHPRKPARQLRSFDIFRPATRGNNDIRLAFRHIFRARCNSRTFRKRVYTRW